MTRGKHIVRATDYIAVAFNRHELERIETAAKLLGLPVSEYIRRQVLKKSKRPQLPRV